LRKALFLLTAIGLVFSAYGESLEERINRLEEKVKQLEKRIERLEGKGITAGETVQMEDSLPVSSPEELVSVKLLSKKFKPMRLKESLWQKSDLIVVKVALKNKTGKKVKNITGKLVIYDDNGEKLAEKTVHVNKALNLFSGTVIQPSEEVKVSVEIEYDGKDGKLKKLKELPPERLKVKFYPVKIQFADGTEKRIIYREN